MIPEIICDFDPWGCLQFAESIFHLRVTFAGEREGGEKKRSPDRTNPKQIKFCLISTVIHFWHSAPFIHEKWKN